MTSASLPASPPPTKYYAAATVRCALLQRPVESRVQHSSRAHLFGERGEKREEGSAMRHGPWRPGALGAWRAIHQPQRMIPNQILKIIMPTRVRRSLMMVDGCSNMVTIATVGSFRVPQHN